MPDLSIIIPFVGEFPHLLYTLQGIKDAFGTQIDYEVICVDNDCDDARRHGVKINPIPECNCSGILQRLIDNDQAPWLRLLKYDQKLSHWACKSFALRYAKADYVMFLDAHCLLPTFGLPAIVKELIEQKIVNHSVHIPIANLVKDDPRIYRLVFNDKIGLLHYENIPLTTNRYRFPVPCASTCGMILHRSMLDDPKILDFWPSEFGPYGGGENLFNFQMALLNKESRIYSDIQPIRHFATGIHWARDYSITPTEWLRNRIIATYLVAGTIWAERFIRHNSNLFYEGKSVITSRDVSQISKEINTNKYLRTRRLWIKERAVRSIKDFIDQWRGTEFARYEKVVS